MAIGRVNTGGGGTGGINYAAIAVTYPTGSTCTCTNGIKTFSAKGTDGSWIFSIPSNGTWTVSCTDGVNTASQAVVITEQYQAASVVLTYSLELIKDGKVKQTFTNNHTTVTEAVDGYVELKSDRQGPYGFAEYSIQLDITGLGYTSLVVDGYASQTTNGYPKFTVTHSGGTQALTLGASRATQTIDTSGMTGTITISIQNQAWNDNIGIVYESVSRFYNMMLTR